MPSECFYAGAFVIFRKVSTVENFLGHKEDLCSLLQRHLNGLMTEMWRGGIFHHGTRTSQTHVSTATSQPLQAKRGHEMPSVPSSEVRVSEDAS